MYSNKSKARLLTNLSNAVRLGILEIVSERETSVNELAERLEMSQSAISQHLARLREGGLVTTRRDAQTVYYRCTNPGVQRVLHMLNEIFSAEFDAANGLTLAEHPPVAG
ncbi:ArsR/SmtB family transcription factor [Agrobacterium sp. Azo12]|uniref:ArsR/SmtB family transcription factor n=1 Tax=Agrobacterium sp. Azo12 TaxID=3031129 RepID=UPI0023D88269|nr:metalloregulator ArsR/SmtB family transcription factor [Agrobacterium sp. Azo12]MDO5897266.1 metalloregulator ArsR/SmtB family transcription factor [Agrobacterium sp. Azo12]